MAPVSGSSRHRMISRHSSIAALASLSTPPGRER
jgi:hypothetical protein